MLSLVIACTGLLAAAPEPEPADPRAPYRAAVAAAGRDADAQVKLALWCEAHGMQAERFKHLAIALLADPGNAAARGLMGLVADAGKWRKPEAVAARVRADADLSAALAEYNRLRAKTPDTAEAQWKLALWCEEEGMKAEATAHLTAVVRLDPNREAAWRRLGYKKQKSGQWTTDEQVAAARAEAEAQHKADIHWKPLLEKWKGLLAGRGDHAGAEDQLAGVTDPRAVPSVAKVFGGGHAADQVRAVQLLGQIDAPSASRALALLAVSGRSAEVCQRATETLKRRDPREYADLLIGLIREKIKYQVRPVGGPGSPGALFVEGKRFNVRRLYSPPPMPTLAMLPGDALGMDQYGLPVVVRRRAQTFDINGYAGMITLPGKPLMPGLTPRVTEMFEADIPVGQMMARAQLSAREAQQQLQEDTRAIDSYNAAAGRDNAQIISVLVAATGQPDLGEDPNLWKRWWVDQLGYSYASPDEGPRPTFEEQVPLAAQPPVMPTISVISASVTFYHHSCFGAGTPVQALGGARPIETLRAGDRVLVQDTKTGALDYQAVLVAYHNPPNATLRITLGDKAIVVTPIHRFWKAGKGWTMARDLKVGDAIRSLGGVARVERIEEDKVQPVFNLEVGRGHSFFVGRRGALVHDNSVVLPTLNPFDAQAAVASTR